MDSELGILGSGPNLTRTAPLSRPHLFKFTLCASSSVSLTVASHYWSLMAEALPIVSVVVADIIQLVEFSSKVLHRLDEFRSSLGKVAQSFQHFSAELPVLKATLQKVKEAIEAGSLSGKTAEALIPAIEGCKEQIQLLDSLLVEMLPNTTDSRLRRSTKAKAALNQEAKVQSITKILHSSIRALRFYSTVVSSTRQALTGDGLHHHGKNFSANS